MLDLASVPTVNLTEVVRIAVNGVEYDAEELFKGVFAGSRTFAYTDADGVGRIIRIRD